jgi:hypothetical protein
LTQYLSEQNEANGISGLTTSTLEVLACIAFRQPISQAEIDRLFDADKRGLVVKLRDLNLVEEFAGSDGRLRFATTEAFLAALRAREFAGIDHGLVLRYPGRHRTVEMSDWPYSRDDTIKSFRIIFQNIRGVSSATKLQALMRTVDPASTRTDFRDALNDVRATFKSSERRSFPCREPLCGSRHGIVGAHLGQWEGVRGGAHE